MKKETKQRMKSILAWVLAVAMIFANVDVVSAETVSAGDLPVEQWAAYDVTEGDASAGDVTGSDVSVSDVTNSDVSEGSVSEGEAEDSAPALMVSGNDVSVSDISANDVSANDVSANVVSVGDVTVIMPEYEAASIRASGEYNGMTWNLTTEGVLTISGTNTNHGIDKYDYPWSSYAEDITKAVVSAQNVMTTAGWFEDCRNLTEVDLGGFDTSNVKNMNFMFKNCAALKTVDFSKFNTENVTSMRLMFYGCKSLSVLDLSSFDTGRVEDMYRMFECCKNLEQLDISSFNTKSVSNMSNMFRDCSSLKTLDVSKFDTANVENMSNLFCGCWSLELLDLNKWNTGLVTDMSRMFADCRKLESVKVSKWDVRNVQDVTAMFSDCNSITKLDLSKWNMNAVTDMTSMFSYCDVLKEVSLGKANSGSLKNLSSMFNGSAELKKIQFGKMNTANVENMKMMFDGCSKLEQLDLRGFDTGNVTNMERMFFKCENLKKLQIQKFNTGNVTNMKNMFWGCRSLTALDVSGFDTSKVEDMSYMFYGCAQVRQLDVSGFKTENVKNMRYLFFDCEDLTELDLSGFDITNVEDIHGLLHSCHNMKRVKVFVNLQQQVYLPSNYMYDLDGNRYEDYYPMGLTESFWLYYDSPETSGNLHVKEVAPQVYTGKAIKPQIVVYNGTDALTERVDYTISYKNNINANDASNPKTAPTIVIKGKGGYSKQDSVTFQILARELTDTEVKAADITKVYNKKVQKPVPVVTYQGKKLVNKKDFTVSYPDLSEENPDAYKAPGTYRILITGKGNFTGERELLFTITDGILMNKVKIAAIPAQQYTGEEICPEVTVTYGKETLIKDTDYTVSYENHIAIGKATVTITGMNAKYAGSKTASFQIVGTSIAKATISGISDLDYTGQPLTQLNLTVELAGLEEPLVLGRDYTVQYTNNIKPGKATITIVGMGGYSGTIKKTFRINKWDLSQGGYGYNFSHASFCPDGYLGWCVEYTKGSTKLKLNYLVIAGIKLVEGKDYTISYVNDIRNITAPDATKRPTLRIKGKGCYTGVTEIDYYIIPSDFESENNSVTMTLKDVEYSEKAGKWIVKPVLIDYNGKKLVAGKDYEKDSIKYYLEDGTELTKDSVVDAGHTITVKVTGKGNYIGVKTGTYRVVQADIKNAKFEITPQAYTGYSIRPGKDDFEVASYKGTDLTYREDYEVCGVKNNIKKGTATVTICGLGNYGGTKSVNFKIVAKEMIWFWKMFD